MKVLKGKRQCIHISNWWHYTKTEILRKNAIKDSVIYKWKKQSPVSLVAQQHLTTPWLGSAFLYLLKNTDTCLLLPKGLNEQK
jgi:hypothetical protein